MRFQQIHGKSTNDNNEKILTGVVVGSVVVVGGAVVVVGVVVFSVDSGVVLIVAIVVVEGVMVEGIFAGMVLGVAAGLTVTTAVAGVFVSLATDVVADVAAAGETLAGVEAGESLVEVEADVTPGVARGVVAACVFAPGTESLSVRVTEVAGRWVEPATDSEG